MRVLEALGVSALPAPPARLLRAARLDGAANLLNPSARRGPHAPLCALLERYVVAQRAAGTGYMDCKGLYWLKKYEGRGNAGTHLSGARRDLAHIGVASLRALEAAAAAAEASADAGELEKHGVHLRRVCRRWEQEYGLGPAPLFPCAECGAPHEFRCASRIRIESPCRPLGCSRPRTNRPHRPRSERGARVLLLTLPPAPPPPPTAAPGAARSRAQRASSAPSRPTTPAAICPRRTGTRSTGARTAGSGRTGRTRSKSRWTWSSAACASPRRSGRALSAPRRRRRPAPVEFVAGAAGRCGRCWFGHVQLVALLLMGFWFSRCNVCVVLSLEWRCRGEERRGGGVGGATARTLH